MFTVPFFSTVERLSSCEILLQALKMYVRVLISFLSRISSCCNKNSFRHVPAFMVPVVVAAAGEHENEEDEEQKEDLFFFMIIV